jgi:hypothetical protein
MSKKFNMSLSSSGLTRGSYTTISKSLLYIDLDFRVKPENDIKISYQTSFFCVKGRVWKPEVPSPNTFGLGMSVSEGWNTRPAMSLRIAGTLLLLKIKSKKFTCYNFYKNLYLLHGKNCLYYWTY